MNSLRNVKILVKPIAIIVASAIFISSLAVYFFDFRQNIYANIVNLPVTQGLPQITPQVTNKTYDLPVIRGLELDPNQPENIKFYFDSMNRQRIQRKDIDRMIKYFLGFLAMPEDKLWVNLSPYEPDRIIPDSLAQLDIGKDMLLEDYVLKQLTAAVTNPKTVHGKKFWQKVYSAAKRIAGTTKVSINSFYKIWIVPDAADVYEYTSARESKIENRESKPQNTKMIAFVKEAKLKVMIEEDQHNIKINNNVKQQGTGLIRPVPDRHNLKIQGTTSAKIQQINDQAKEIFKKELLPIIEEQVNKSITFAPLRQMYYALILANYFKQKFCKVGFYQGYVNRAETEPIKLNDFIADREIIYRQYQKNFNQRGNLSIKNMRNCFSGGVVFSSGGKLIPVESLQQIKGLVKTVEVSVKFSSLGSENLSVIMEKLITLSQRILKMDFSSDTMEGKLSEVIYNLGNRASDVRQLTELEFNDFLELLKQLFYAPDISSNLKEHIVEMSKNLLLVESSYQNKIYSLLCFFVSEVERLIFTCQIEDYIKEAFISNALAPVSARGYLQSIGILKNITLEKLSGKDVNISGKVAARAISELRYLERNENPQVRSLAVKAVETFAGFYENCSYVEEDYFAYALLEAVFNHSQIALDVLSKMVLDPQRWFQVRRIVRKSRELRQKLSEQDEYALRLIHNIIPVLMSLRFRQGGYSDANEREEIMGLLGVLPVAQGPERLIPEFKEEDCAEIPFSQIFPLKEGDFTPDLVFRSLVANEGDGKILAVKLLKRWDNPEKLMREAFWMKHLNQNMDLKDPVLNVDKFKIPIPREFNGSSVIKLTQIPEEIRQKIPGVVSFNQDDSVYALCFSADEDYFSYVNDYVRKPAVSPQIINENDFKQVMFQAAYLLGNLTAQGVMDSDLIALFHNRAQVLRRSDSGAYHWWQRGRLDQWLFSCDYPNIAASIRMGLPQVLLRDFEDFFSWGKDISPQAYQEQDGFYHIIGTQLFSLFILTGSYLRNKIVDQDGKRVLGVDSKGMPVDVRHLINSDFFRETIKGICLHYYRGFVGRDYGLDFSSQVERLVAQMVERMGQDLDMEEILRTADQEGMTEEQFKAFLQSRDFSPEEILELLPKKGKNEIVMMTGPHLGGFNSTISIPLLVDTVEDFSLICLVDRYQSLQNSQTSQKNLGNQWSLLSATQRSFSSLPIFGKFQKGGIDFGKNPFSLDSYICNKNLPSWALDYKVLSMKKSSVSNLHPQNQKNQN